jgi:hypothetical protein
MGQGLWKGIGCRGTTSNVRTVHLRETADCNVQTIVVQQKLAFRFHVLCKEEA